MDEDTSTGGAKETCWAHCHWTYDTETHRYYCQVHGLVPRGLVPPVESDFRLGKSPEAQAK